MRTINGIQIVESPTLEQLKQSIASARAMSRAEYGDHHGGSRRLLKLAGFREVCSVMSGDASTCGTVWANHDLGLTVRQTGVLIVTDNGESI
jgi:hypothetical protein